MSPLASETRFADVIAMDMMLRLMKPTQLATDGGSGARV